MATKNGSGAIRVLLASASAVRRAGFEVLVKQSSSFTLVGAAQGTQTIGQRAVELQADVVLADFERETPVIARSGLPVVALIDNPAAGWAAQALRSGVKSILPREAGSEEIVAAIHAAYTGLVLLDPAIAQQMVERVGSPPTQIPESYENLTPREIEVLASLAEGLANREIADRLGVSDHTIKFHISSILDKLGASTRTEAVTLGLRMGLIVL
ncbi:MAG: DNA-binding response regulator [Acidobacteria bacterium]|nr:MAG: DNA-binding response regulator [Acidobacteriota bacterium]